MDRRTQKTRESIQSAYFSLIKEHTSKITVAEIARKANIDRKTFYLHYETIDGIFQEFSRERINEFLYMLENSGFFNRPFDTIPIFEALNIIVLPDIDLYKCLVKNPDYRFFWDQLQETIIQTMEQIYCDKTQLSIHELHLYATLLVSGVISVFIAWLKNEIPFTLDSLGMLASDAAFYGLQKPFAILDLDKKAALTPN